MKIKICYLYFYLKPNKKQLKEENINIYIAVLTNSCLVCVWHLKSTISAMSYPNDLKFLIGHTYVDF